MIHPSVPTSPYEGRTRTAPLALPADGEAFLETARSLATTLTRERVVRTVAVVGNQPLGHDEARSAWIDSADLVVRVNGFRLDEEQPSVGRRCDVVVFNRGVRATPWFFAGYRSRLYLMVEPGRFHSESEQIPPWWPVDLGALSVPNRSVLSPINDGMGLDARGQGRWATTGTFSIALADRLFRDAKLRICGFSFLQDTAQTQWDHAYGDPCIVGGEHSLEHESRWVLQLLRSRPSEFRA